MRKPLWIPSTERKKRANITRFISFINNEHNLNIESYNQLYNWSLENMSDFWAAIWEFGEIKASQKYEKIVKKIEKFPGARWFVGAKLNFAENLLRYKDAHNALIFKGEAQTLKRTSYLTLYDSVARLAEALREIGIGVGDRVAAYMPNLAETAIAMLAATSIGAIWSSCGAELGPKAVVNRFSQIEPKILFTVDGYYYKGQTFNVLKNAEEVVKEIASLKKTIVFRYVSKTPMTNPIANSVLYEDCVSNKGKVKAQFEQLSSDHPVYIMFSSGTTGNPKCMVQGAAGVLINHLKELILHTDLKREDKICYITSPSWMMWNWLLSSLSVGSTIVLYDGNPSYPDWKTMWQLVQDEKITIFGCSASYINYLKAIGAQPGKNFDLLWLREISQTGSPLSTEGFEYVYSEIKKDLHFNSISGGTDINGCFAAGTPIQPVYAGELQGPALAMNIKAYDENGNHVVDKQAELVCETPSPSMPLYFWNDQEGKKYRGAYFNVYPNVWRHGDWILIHEDTGGITFLGRSDFTLKPSGVRIGPSEIYNIVGKFKEIADSVVVGQNWKGDQRVILFVKLASEFQLTNLLKTSIKKALRKEASPRHVPALIIEAPDIPYTFSMKKVESAITNIVNGLPITNRDALINPEALDFYEKITSELQAQ